ncbi:MAG: site-2 protease family protein [Planctomycetia bacterium]|nr:site-2 protease family protein [Planctomycetia bacterium]
MFYEPNRSPYDLQFQWFGIPIRISPWFWFLAILLGAGANNAQGLVLWVAAVLVSILVHELGHAVVLRHYGFDPRIVLYSFGGLTIHNRTHRLFWYENILISFAGPLAGFLFLCLILGIFYLLGYHHVGNLVLGLFRSDVSLPIIVSPYMTYFLFYLVQVNLFWGILNLMPIFPLDGGQITRELLQWFSPYRGFRWTMQISMGVSLALALYFFSQGSFFAPVMFGMIAFSNYQMLQMYRS